MSKRKKKHPFAGFKVQSCMKGKNGEIIPWCTVEYDDEGNKTVTYHVDEEQSAEWTNEILDNVSKKCNEIANRHDSSIRQAMIEQGVTSCDVQLMDVLRN